MSHTSQAEATNYDAIVVGSGVAGMAAAVAAAQTGARVLVLEATEHLGGTSATSGGMVWAPGNSHLAEPDDPDAAFEYAVELTGGLGPGPDLIRDYLDSVNESLDFFEQTCDLTWRPSVTYSDYFGDRPGGRLAGRSLIPAEFELEGRLPSGVSLRRSPYLPSDLDLDEMELLGMAVKGSGAAGSAPAGVDGTFRPEVIRERQRRRRERGVVCNGLALMGRLVEAALRQGVEILTETRVVDLIRSDVRVVGVVSERSGERTRQLSRGGVVLASGGFENDAGLSATFLGARPLALSSPANIGDGLLLGLAAGGRVSNMTEALSMPCTWTGEVHDGHPHNVSLITPRNQPGAIMVNGLGVRFANEGVQYSDLGKALRAFDATSGSWPNRNAWVIFDQRLRDSFCVLDLRPSDPTPPWVLEAPTIEGLAEQLDVPSAALHSTIERYNADVVTQRPDEFARGDVWFNRQPRLTDGAPPPLRPIDRAPFFALRVHDAVVGTFGGLRITGLGQVLRWDGSVIDGLYASGNVAANPFGPRYPGGGSSIGPALVFAHRAARHLTGQLPHATQPFTESRSRDD